MAKRNRRSEFEATALVHLDRLFDMALRLCGSRTEAEELVYETCLRAFRRFDRMKAPSGDRAWLLAILHDTFVCRSQAVGREGVEGERAESNTGEGGYSGALTPGAVSEEGWLQQVDEVDFATAFARLPFELRELVVLADLEGCSYSEIKRICGIPRELLASRLLQGRQLLREALMAAFCQRKGSQSQS